MGNKLSIQKVNFEDIQNVVNNNIKNVLIINTLENTSEAQYCILPGTISYANEEKIINNYLNDNKQIRIIIYGKNVNDISIYKKFTQLMELGFENVYVYPGGMFEWLLLQDIYGDDLFKTTAKELDILKYKPINQFMD
jgi:rhodanese-related sulfurtransferase